MSAGERPPMNAQETRVVLAAARAEVLGALEKGKSLTQPELMELRQTVQEAITAYEALLASSPDQKAELEISLGRQVIDLRRQAGLLPQFDSGRPAAHAVDRVAGGRPFIETRLPPSWHAPSGDRPRVDKKRLSPGDEVDAWCGPCNGIRTHNIVAMVGEDPKQVVCQSCNGRHGFRLTPARTKSDDGQPRPVRSTMVKRKKTPEEQAEERRQNELQALRNELSAVKDVIPFDPKRRYKAGEVIEHNEYGRGRVETAMKGTILVRFGTGRRSLILR